MSSVIVAVGWWAVCVVCVAFGVVWLLVVVVVCGIGGIGMELSELLVNRYRRS